MESRNVMMFCSKRVADELIAQDENFKYVICICSWLNDDDDWVLAADKCMWDMLVRSGKIYRRKDVAGVKEHDDEK